MTTAAAASHTYRTVTLTRYTLNYATLPDDPQLCRGPRSGKKKLFPKPSSLVIIFFFSLGGDFRVGSCRTRNNTASYHYYGRYTIILSAAHDGRASCECI